MVNDGKNCSRCVHAHDCKSVYEYMGRLKGPSIVLKALTAFIIPILVFIASLAGFNTLFGIYIKSGYIQTLLTFILSGAVVFLWILLVKRFFIKADRKLNNFAGEGEVKSKPRAD